MAAEFLTCLLELLPIPLLAAGRKWDTLQKQGTAERCSGRREEGAVFLEPGQASSRFAEPPPCWGMHLLGQGWGLTACRRRWRWRHTRKGQAGAPVSWQVPEKGKGFSPWGPFASLIQQKKSLKTSVLPGRREEWCRQRVSCRWVSLAYWEGPCSGALCGKVHTLAVAVSKSGGCFASASKQICLLPPQHLLSALRHRAPCPLRSPRPPLAKRNRGSPEGLECQVLLLMWRGGGAQIFITDRHKAILISVITGSPPFSSPESLDLEKERAGLLSPLSFPRLLQWWWVGCLFLVKRCLVSIIMRAQTGLWALQHSELQLGVLAVTWT